MQIELLPNAPIQRRDDKRLPILHKANVAQIARVQNGVDGLKIKGKTIRVPLVAA
jgi:hypothetical protein